MHTLIVVAHPVPTSMTHQVAQHVAAGIAASGAGHTYEIADLATEGFDPRFTATDTAVLHGAAKPSPDVSAEQARIDRSDVLVLVYPVYWWAFPGLLKGWIDRVFTQGWAYEDNPNGSLIKKLSRLQVHLIALGGASRQTYVKHGFAEAMKTQIEHGIFDFCGAHIATSTLLLPSDAEFPASSLQTAQEIGSLIGSGASPSHADA